MATMFGYSETPHSMTNNDAMFYDKWQEATSIAKLPEGWQDEIIKMSGKSSDDIIKTVNNYINKNKYKREQNEDRWIPPSQLFKNGGDCEDFAISKMVALQQSGITKPMRVVVGWDSKRRQHHAMLAVYDGDDIKILDNVDSNVKSHKEMKDFVPIYSLDGGTWWLHK